MTFPPKSWVDYPTTTTPINATALVDLETRLAAYADLLGGGAIGGEPLQPGFMGLAAASNGITAVINSGTRVLTFSNWPATTPDVAWSRVSGTGVWVPGTITNTAPTTLTPGTIATSTQFAGVAVDAVPPAIPGGACTFIVTKGTDQVSAALAALNQPAVTAGNLRMWDGIMTQTGAVYSLVSGGTGANAIPAATGRDRRAWARGVLNSITRTAGNYTTASGSFVDIDATNLAIRVECSGVPMRVGLIGICSNSSVTAFNNFAINDNGTVVMREDIASHATTNQTVPLVVEGIITPSAGSHLIKPQFFTSAGTVTAYATSATDNQLFFYVEEIVRPMRINGVA